MASHALIHKEVQVCEKIRVHFLSQIRVEYDSKVIRNHPLGLKKLAIFIQECYTQQTGNTIPCIVITTPNFEGFCRAVITSGQDLHDRINSNIFMQAFICAAELAKANYKFASFDQTTLDI